MFKVAIRDDINMKMFDQGVISDGAGVVLLNLMQQDVRVLRVTFPLVWVAANPVTRMSANRAASYPASSVLQGTFVVPMLLPGGEQQALEGGGQPQLVTEHGGAGSAEGEDAPAR